MVFTRSTSTSKKEKELVECLNLLINKKPVENSDADEVKSGRKPATKRKTKRGKNEEMSLSLVEVPEEAEPPVQPASECEKNAVVLLKKIDLEAESNVFGSDRFSRQRSPSIAPEIFLPDDYNLAMRTTIFAKSEHIRSSEPLKPPPVFVKSTVGQVSNTLFIWLMVFLLIFLVFALKPSSFLINMGQVGHYYLKAVLLLIAFCLIFKAFYRYLAPLCSSSTQILLYGTISFLALFGLLIVFIMFFFGCIFLDYCKLNINLNYSTNSNIFAAFEMHKMFASIF